MVGSVTILLLTTEAKTSLLYTVQLCRVTILYVEIPAVVELVKDIGIQYTGHFGWTLITCSIFFVPIFATEDDELLVYSQEVEAECVACI